LQQRRSFHHRHRIVSILTMLALDHATASALRFADSRRISRRSSKFYNRVSEARGENAANSNATK